MRLARVVSEREKEKRRERVGEEGAFARGWRRLSCVPAQPAPMRYWKDGEEVAQVGGIASSRAGRHRLGAAALSFPAASPPGRAPAGAEVFCSRCPTANAGWLAGAQP